LTADNYVFPYSNANDMHVTQDLNSFGNISVISGWSVSLVVISTECTGICKSNSHTITTMMTSSARGKNPLESRIYEQIAKYLTADNSVVHKSNANDMRVTQDLNSFGEI
jgi:uncharacterized protein YaiI (UPF0178 family)